MPRREAYPKRCPLIFLSDSARWKSPRTELGGASERFPSHRCSFNLPLLEQLGRAYFRYSSLDRTRSRHARLRAERLPRGERRLNSIRDGTVSRRSFRANMK